MMRSVVIECFSHPTESFELVKKAFMAVSPKSPDVIQLTTHFGSKIIRLTARLTKKKDIAEFISKLKSMPNEDKVELLNEVDSRLSDGMFHFSLDKFKALDGEISLGTGEQIRVSIKFVTYPHNSAKIKGEVIDMLEGLL